MNLVILENLFILANKGILVYLVGGSCDSDNFGESGDFGEYYYSKNQVNVVSVGYLSNMVDLVILVNLMILVTLVIIVQSVTIIKISKQTNV